MKNNNLSGGLFQKKPTPLTQKETSLSARIAAYLDAIGVYNDRLQCGQFQTPSGNWMRGSKRGTPDRFAIVRGQIIFVEVKRTGEKPTGEQLAKHEELEAAGAIVLVCDCFEQFKAQLSAVRQIIESNKREVNLYD